MRVVAVHDYFTQVGGAERVAISFLSHPDVVALATAFFDSKGTHAVPAGVGITTSPANRVKLFRHDPRLAAPILPHIFQNLRLPPHDALLVSTSGYAHQVRTNAPKIVYCHNPPRWLYEPESYAGNSRIARFATRALRGQRASDQRAAQGASCYIANSSNVANKIHSTYGIQARIVRPPVLIDTTGQSVRPTNWPDHFPQKFILNVSRDRGYKGVQNIVDVVSMRDDIGLVTVGGQSARPRVGNAVDLGRVSEAELRWLYKNCLAVAALGVEDFGLTPIEGHAYGKPTLALSAGGYLETVVEGKNGVFIADTSPNALMDGLDRVITERWVPGKIRQTAQRFQVEEFTESLMAIVKEQVTNNQGRRSSR